MSADLPPAPPPHRTRRVLGFIPPGLTAVSYLRFLQPFDYLGLYGYELRTLGETVEAERHGAGYRITPSILDGIDMVIFPQVIWEAGLAQSLDPYPLIEELCDEAARRRIPIVYSPDDAVRRVTADNPTYDPVAHNWPLVDLVRSRADALIVTTPALLNELGDGRTPVHVLPNAIEPRRWRPRPRTSGEWRVGWAGSGSHAENLLLVLPAIRELTRRYPVRFVIQGLTAEPLAEAATNILRSLHEYTPAARIAGERIVEVAQLLREVGGEHRPFRPIEDYFGDLAALDLDIGLCPLIDTPFNRCKSSIKYYEYAMCETLAIASRVEPFVREVSIAVPNDTRSWRDTIEYWLRRPDERDDEARHQKAYVLAMRNIETLCTAWARALDEIVAK